MGHFNLSTNKKTSYIINMGYQVILLLNVTLIFYYLKLS